MRYPGVVPFRYRGARARQGNVVVEFCFHCSARADPRWRFCRECGTGLDVAPVANRSNFCTECGEKLAMSWRYCTRCAAPTPVANVTRSTRLTDEEMEEWVGVTSGTVAVETAASGSPPPATPLVEPGRGARPFEAGHFDDGHFEGDHSHDVPSPDMPSHDVLSHDEPSHVAAGDTEQIEHMETAEDELAITARTSASAGPQEHETPDLIADPPSVELISRKWDVIDLRPVEAEQAEEPLVSSSGPAPASTSTTDDQLVFEDVADDGTGVESYRSSTRIGAMAQLALLILGLVAMVTIVALVVLNNRLEDFAVDGSGTSDGIVSIRNVINQWLRPIMVGLGVVTLGLVIVWGHRVYSNLPPLGKPDLRMPRKAAIWSWFVPVVNLVLPARLINDAWRGADVYAAPDMMWKERPGNVYVPIFWLAIIGFVVATIVGGLLGADPVETALDSNGWAAIGYGLLIIGCLAAVRMIGTISDRQQTRARSLRGLV